MQYNVYFLKYNNYYDRLLKRLSTVSEYIELDSNYHVETDVFNISLSDGVTFNMVVNNMLDNKDYALVCDTSDNILSRYFILDTTYNLQGQSTVTLYRDTLADYWDTVKATPAFIDKAMLNAGSNLIFNSENMTYNQIKSGEKLLCDGTQCPWIVGYYNKSSNLNGNAASNNGSADIIVDSTYANWEYNSLFTTPMKTQPTLERINMNVATNLYRIASYTNNTYYYTYSSLGSNVYVHYPNNQARDTAISTVLMPRFSAANQYVKLEPNMTSRETLEDIWAYDGKLVQFTDRRVRIQVISGDKIYSDITTPTVGFSLYNELIQAVTASGGTVQEATNPFTYTYSYFNIHLESFETSEGNYSYSIPSSRLHTNDQPFDMFAIPYSDNFSVGVPGATFYTKRDIGLAVATDMAQTSEVYDVQILPYCPISGITYREYNGLTGNANEYSLIKDSNNNSVGIIFNVISSSFYKTLDTPLQQMSVADTAVEQKVQSECDKFRLCSPNYNGVFEFSSIKNGGVAEFEISCTYLPFQPYIHINPKFGGLYGRDYNDQRGLICGGNFSISTVSDQWKQYMVNNKNYNDIFNREIQNMEVHNMYAQAADIVGAITGTFGGAAGGLALGGNAASAGVGAAFSAAAGITDVFINNKLRHEALDYKNDMYGFQLGNIQSLPQSLTRTTSYNIDSKYFPFIEYYTCTDIEKQALRDKIKYNGMTVGVIGKVEDYIKSEVTYIKAKPIRLAIGDFHISNVIGSELDKGVFV